MSLALRRALAYGALAGGLTFCYAALATRLNFDVWQLTSGGLLYNGQLSSLLDGRADIDPAMVGIEGYVRDGKTYTYFGILPALMRLPVAHYLWIDWTTIYCVAAAAIAAMALLLALQRILQERNFGAPAMTAVPAAMMSTLLLSGPSIELLGKPSVYCEAILWSFTFACLFIHNATPLLLGQRTGGRHLTTLALCAAAGLLTRASTGIALYCAFALVALIASIDTRLRGPGLKPLLAPLALPSAILLGAIVVTGVINNARWGNPLQFVNFSYHNLIRQDPERLARLEHYGVFDPTRIPYSLAYYFVPDLFFDMAADGPHAGRIKALFDPPEGPPVSLLLTSPLWFSLAAFAIVRLAVNRRASVLRLRRVATLAVGLLVAPLLVLMYVYLAFRYRVEFVPALALLAITGTRLLASDTVSTSSALRRIVGIGVVALAVTQIAEAHLAAVQHRCTPFGPYADAERQISQCHFIEGSR